VATISGRDDDSEQPAVTLRLRAPPGPALTRLLPARISGPACEGGEGAVSRHSLRAYGLRDCRETCSYSAVSVRAERLQYQYQYGLRDCSMGVTHPRDRTVILARCCLPPRGVLVLAGHAATRLHSSSTHCHIAKCCRTHLPCSPCSSVLVTFFLVSVRRLAVSLFVRKPSAFAHP
jgi:hypothetical protein